MPSSRKILFLVAFVVTVALIGLVHPAMGESTSAAAGSIDTGSAAKLFKRSPEGNCEDKGCVWICDPDPQLMSRKFFKNAPILGDIKPCPLLSARSSFSLTPLPLSPPLERLL
ncbi:MAG: hypothetical protein J3R72DRAFT_513044 [Linnemannia gamsii]|nr:MAG: hypothetical protein J3R72DRAFT_513044 [Linnemannia gamsii]